MPSQVICRQSAMFKQNICLLPNLKIDGFITGALGDLKELECGGDFRAPALWQRNLLPPIIHCSKHLDDNATAHWVEEKPGYSVPPTWWKSSLGWSVYEWTNLEHMYTCACWWMGDNGWRLNQQRLRDYRATGQGASMICHGLVPQLPPLTVFSLD